MSMSLTNLPIKEIYKVLNAFVPISKRDLEIIVKRAEVLKIPKDETVEYRIHMQQNVFYYIWMHSLVLCQRRNRKKLFLLSGKLVLHGLWQLYDATSFESDYGDDRRYDLSDGHSC